MTKRKVLQYNLNGEFIKMFESVKEACVQLNVKSHSNIISACNGKSNSVYGYQWRYYEDGFPIKIQKAVKRGEVFKKKYGIESENHSDFIDKIKKTSIIKYGVNHAMKKDFIVQKYKETCKSLYGVDNPAKSDEIRQKISKSERIRKSKNYLSEKIDEDLYQFLSMDSDDSISIRGKNCGHDFVINRQLLTVRKNANHEICTICNNPKKNQTSEVENGLYDDLKILGHKIDKNVVGLINTREEIDIFFPDFNFGIEVNGIKYHSEEFGRGQFHHINKTKRFGDSGIEIFHFFDDEIEEKREIVLSMIKNKLGVSSRIYARKCQIRSINNNEAIIFLRNNHIQGPVNSKFSYGLFHNKELVSVMTFGELRLNLGSKKENGTYELLRFCNKINTTVVGAASKLMNKFISEISPNKIISYANLRWSKGNLYRKIGFTTEKKVNPGYYIFHKNKRHNRYKYRKSELLKMGNFKGLTSEQIFEKIGAFKIWDCGNIKFEISFG